MRRSVAASSLRFIPLFALTTLAALPPPVQADGSYSGHGAESVSPETVRAYAPKPLDPQVSRRVQLALDTRSPGSGVLTADGKRLFFTWGVTGVAQAWRLNGPNQFPVQMTGGEDATFVADVAPNGKFLVLSRDRKGEENPGIYLQSTEGGELETILHEPKVRAFLQFISEDSRFLYFTANDIKPDATELYRLDLVTHQKEHLFGKTGQWSVSDHDLKRGELLLTHAKGNVAREIHRFHLATKALEPVLGVGEDERYAARFSAQKNELLVRTDKFGDFSRLYRLKQSQWKAVSPELKADVDSFGIDLARKRIYYTVNDQGYSRVFALDAKTYRPVKLPQFAGSEQTYLVGLSPDGRYATFRVEMAQAPALSRVWDFHTLKLTSWTTPSAPETDPRRFVKATLESYPARDGTRIPMFVRRPPQCAQQTCPVVVHFHGGPEGQTTPGFSRTWQTFVDAGFIVAEPNVRGSEGYGKKWLHSDDGPKRLDVVTDIEDAARFIRSAWAVNGVTPKVGIMGGSYGGYSTLFAMTRFAGAYDAGVAVVGMSNLKSFLLNTAPYRRVLRITEYGDPEKDAEALRLLSPVTYVDQIKAPLLIIQGVSDPRVPVGEALQMYEKAKAKGAELMLFADEGHGAAKRENKVFEIGHALRFFETHLKATTQAAAK